MVMSQALLKPGRKKVRSPLSIRNCALWLRPDDGVYTGGCRTLVAGDKTSFQIADASQTGLDFGTSDVSICGYVYFTNVTGAQWIYSKGAGEAASLGISVYRNGTGLNAYFIGTGPTVVSVTVGTVAAGQWHFFAVIADRDGNLTGYLNNVAGTPSSIAACAAHNLDNSLAVAIGAYSGIGGAISSWLDGSIASIGVWKRVLTPAERTWLYNLKNARVYAELGIAGTDGAALLTSLVSYWNCNETDPTTGLVDQHSTNDLTRTAAELATNGAFTTDASWTKGTGWTVDAADSNVATSDASQTADSDLEQACTVVSGNKYTTSLKVTSRTAGNVCVVVGGTEGTDRAVDGTFTQDITVASTNNKIAVRADLDFAGNVDDFSVKSAAIAVGNGPSEAIASDSIGTNHLTFTGVTAAGQITNWKSNVPTPLSSQGGYAYQFDGVDDAALGANDAVDVSGTKTVSLWFKNNTANMEVFFYVSNTGKTSTDYLAIGSKGGTIYASSAGAVNSKKTSSVLANVWHHCAVVKTAGSVSAIYIDGVADTNENTDYFGGTNVKTALGASYTTGSWAVGINGSLDDVRVYNAALDGTQIGQLYAGGEATALGVTVTPTAHWKFDDGPFGIPAEGDPVWGWESLEGNRTLFSQPTAGSRPVYHLAEANGRPAIYFDGTDDLLNLASAALTGTQGTVMIVAKLDGTTASRTFLSSSDTATTSKYLQLGTNASSQVQSIQDNTDTDDIVRGGSTVNTNLHAYFFESDGSAYTLAIDNVNETKTVVGGADNGDWWDDSTGKDNTVIGALTTTSSSLFFKGWVFDIVVYSTKLTTGQRNSLWKDYVRKQYAL